MRWRFFAPAGQARASPFGRGVCEADGEGKPVSREPPRSDKQALCQSVSPRLYISVSVLALSVSLRSPAPPEGEPFHPQTCAKGPETCVNRACPGGGGKFRPDWLDGGGDRLTEDARNIIINELGDYLGTGSVWLWYGEVEPGQSAQAQAESMKRNQGIEIALLDSGIPTLQAIAFTRTDKKSDGHRYYLALETYATIKTPQT